jgi:DNA polymerase III delta subunit
MSQAKVVIVDRIEAMITPGDDDDVAAPARGRGEKTARELLMDYIKQPEPSCVLVLRGEKVSPGKLKDAMIAAGYTFLNADKDSIPGGLPVWIRNTAKKQHHIAIADEAIMRLAENLGADLGRIDMELAKLSVAAAAFGKKEIDEDLAAYFGAFSQKMDPWTIHAAIASGDVERALQHARDLIDVSRLSEVTLLIFLADLARKLDGLARGAANRENDMSLFTRFKVWGESRQLLEYAKQFGPRRTAIMMRDAFGAYSKAVSGRGDGRLLAEQLIVRLTTAFASLHESAHRGAPQGARS